MKRKLAQENKKNKENINSGQKKTTTKSSIVILKETRPEKSNIIFSCDESDDVSEVQLSEKKKKIRRTNYR